MDRGIWEVPKSPPADAGGAPDTGSLVPGRRRQRIPSREYSSSLAAGSRPPGAAIIGG
jgi:hypothetical protein